MKTFKTLMLVALVVFLMTLFASCIIRNSNSYPDQNKGSDHETVNKIDSTDAPSVPYSNDLPKWFFSFEDFNDTILYQKEPAFNIDTISFYFTPEYIPEGVSLRYIQVKDAYVAIYYSIINCENDYYVFEWYRLLKEGQLQNGILYSFAESSISSIDRYYVVKGEDSNLSDVFWEQDGYVFHAVIPSYIQFEEWNRFCQIKKVEIQLDEVIKNEAAASASPIIPQVCTEVPTASDAPVTEIQPSERYTDELNKSNETAPPFMILASSDKTVSPLVLLYSCEKYVENLEAFIHATEAPIDFASILSSLPELGAEEEYRILTGDNKLISMSVFSVDRQNQDNIRLITEKNSHPGLFKPDDYVDEFNDEKTIVVQFKIAVNGKYIPEANQSESFIYSCLFKISSAVPQDTLASTTDSQPTLKPTEEPETTADLPDDDPIETVFRFTSYESLITTLCEKNSEEHILFRDGINGKNYSGLFIELIDKLESENESLLLPYFDGELALIDSAREWQKITLFSEDLFGIPWLWFYCSIGGESYVICLSPLDVGLEIGDYNDFISVFCGDDFAYPMPSNKTEFSDIYSDIYSEELIFRDGTSCSSTVYELRTGRIQYRFILGNCIFSIWKYNGGSIPNQAWQKLSFDYYSE